MESLESRRLLATFSVTSVADSGPGTLRQALLDSNATTGDDVIAFALPGAGVHSIIPTSPLPSVADPVTIDATTQPGYSGTPLVEVNGSNILSADTPPAPLFNIDGLDLTAGSSVVKGLAINRFTGYGIRATGGGNTISANFVGTDPAGTRALGNANGGLDVASNNNVIGGPTAASRNVISGNSGFGVVIVPGAGGQVGNNRVQGNLIGTDASGSANLGNASGGILVESSQNLIGGATTATGNTIAFNGGAGVQVGFYDFESGVTGNAIQTNAISANAGLGVDLGNPGVSFNTFGGSGFGPNNHQSFPVLSSAYRSAGGTTIEGQFNAQPNSPFTLQFFGNAAPDPSGYGEGQTFLGSMTVITDALGNADIATVLPQSLPVGQFLTATATDASGDTSEFSKATVVAASAQADLSISGYASDATASAGSNLTYTLFVTNNGPSEATNVALADAVPQGAVFLSGQATQGNVSPTATGAVASLGNLASGQSVTVTVTVLTSAVAVGAAANTAIVTADQADPVSSNNTSAIYTTVTPAPPTDLSLFAYADQGSVNVGDQVTFTFVVSNQSAGTLATGVAVTDLLPSGLAFVSARSSQGTTSASADGTVTASLGTLIGNANATVTVVARATSPGVANTSASVRGNETDTNALNNSATVQVSINPQQFVDLLVNIEEAPGDVQVGRELTYVVAVLNGGSGTATGVNLANTLPDDATIDSVRTSQGTVSLSGTTLSASLGSLVGGAQALVTIVLHAGAPGPLVDSATASADQSDFNIANNYATNSTEVTAPSAPPTVVNQRLIVTHRAITGVALTFSQAMDPALAADPSNYQVLNLGRDGRIAATGPAVALASVTYDPATRTVTLTPRQALVVGRFYKVVANGPGALGLTNTSGVVLDGDANGQPDGIYQSLVGRGTRTRPAAVQVVASSPKPAKAPHATLAHAAAKAKVAATTARPHPAKRGAAKG